MRSMKDTEVTDTDSSYFSTEENSSASALFIEYQSTKT